MASAPSVQEEPLQPGTKHFRNQLAATVRSIGWSYAIFWSIPTSRSGVLTWNDGFYNGDIKTRKITNSTDDLTADQLVLQRSEQLRELYNSLLSGECDHRARRPAAALSPEDLGDTEWYYVVCMTYTFRPGQGLPGKSFATNEFVWLCNARTADRKTFPRALLAKVDKASILAETIDYIKELKKTVKELESSVDEPSRRRPIDTRGRRRHELAGRVSGAKRKPPSSEGGGDGDVERARRCVLLSQNGPSNVTVTVADKEVLLEVQCRWKELLMTRVFDAIKSLSLDVISVQASSPDGLLELKIRANKFASSGIVAPGMISEALRKAIGS
ncbi:hypothetical protein ABZP36_008007 [Zizania latifolia]